MVLGGPDGGREGPAALLILSARGGGLCSLQPGKPAAPASRIPPRRRHGSQSFPHSGEGQGRPDPAPGSQWNALDGAKETKHVRKVCWRPCSSPLPLAPRGLPAPALASQVALGL